MTTPSEQLRTAAETLRELAGAATPGPWEFGDRWHVGAVMPMFGEGKCYRCSHDEPTWVGRSDINGTRMPAHVHTDAAPWFKHGINAVRDDGPVSVVNDTDEGGYMTNADAAFIALMDPNVALLLADWLDSAAYEAEMVGADRFALALAEHINGRTHG